MKLDFQKITLLLQDAHQKLVKRQLKLLDRKCGLIFLVMPKLPFRKTFSKHMKHIYIQELPSEKLTKEIKPKPEAPKLDLAQIFESDDDASFHGFDIVMNNPRVN